MKQPEQANAGPRLQPAGGQRNHTQRKARKPRLSRKAHQRLSDLTAAFADALRHDSALESLIQSSLHAFRSDLQSLIRAQFPLRRGRPPDPQLDEAYRLVTQGKSVPQVARIQFPDWSRKDPYERYLILKGLGQAVRRRRPRPYKRGHKRKPGSLA